MTVERVDEAWRSAAGSADRFTRCGALRLSQP